ncbi:MAG: hypothetical protein R2770_18525 [Acidimicrobiales bacterium]|nr:hypothetical protein [Acidimicrobiales bacterium]
MTSGRYLVLGLASVRAVWPREVTGWAMAGALPIEFVKCVSVEEVRARLRSGRKHSAVLVDSAALGIDRDLFSAIAEADAAAIVVGSDDRDWIALGAHARLHEVFSRQDLIERLSAHAVAVGEVMTDPQQVFADAGPVAFRGRTIAVTGRCGSGVSTLAIALAQAFGSDAATAGQSVLADLSLDADQAMLHDATDIVPGVQELVDGHRSSAMASAQIRRLTYSVPGRRYDLLLGLRRRQDWVAVRPRAFAAALDGLNRTYRRVVADISADFEGELETGSLDIEDRNTMARVTALAADLVLVVGRPDLVGVHGLVGVIDALVGLGVEPDRIVPVFNGSPKSKRTRAEAAQALAELVDIESSLRDPIHIGTVKNLDDVHRNGTLLPHSLVRAIAQPVDRALSEVEPLDPSGPMSGVSPEPVAIGSLGTSGSTGSGRDEAAS